MSDDADDTPLDLDDLRAAIEHDGPPTRAELEAWLTRPVTDSEWHTVQDLCPAPALCIDCRAVELVAVTPGWLESQGWEVWRGGARCPACCLRRCA